MIILIPKKSFDKKIQKWVRPKDFLICDATSAYDGSMTQYGNVIDCDDLAGTPTLQKIALDPNSDESRIKRQHLGKYLDTWLGDESFNLKIYHLAKNMLKLHNDTGEDLNVFIVYTDPMFYGLGSYIVDHINDSYGIPIATSMTHKLDKPVIKEILNRQFDSDYWRALKKALKQQAKVLHIKQEANLDLMSKGIDDFEPY